MNLDEYYDIGTQWIPLYVLNNNITCFDSFGVENVPKEIKKLLIIKTYEQIFSEYKHIIWQCVDIFILDLLILCLKTKS